MFERHTSSISSHCMHAMRMKCLVIIFWAGALSRLQARFKILKLYDDEQERNSCDQILWTKRNKTEHLSIYHRCKTIIIENIQRKKIANPERKCTRKRWRFYAGLVAITAASVGVQFDTREAWKVNADLHTLRFTWSSSNRNIIRCARTPAALDCWIKVVSVFKLQRTTLYERNMIRLTFRLIRLLKQQPMANIPLPTSA